MSQLPFRSVSHATHVVSPVTAIAGLRHSSDPMLTESVSDQIASLACNWQGIRNRTERKVIHLTPFKPSYSLLRYPLPRPTPFKYNSNRMKAQPLFQSPYPIRVMNEKGYCRKRPITPDYVIEWRHSRRVSVEYNDSSLLRSFLSTMKKCLTKPLFFVNMMRVVLVTSLKRVGPNKLEFIHH